MPTLLPPLFLYSPSATASSDCETLLCFFHQFICPSGIISPGGCFGRESGVGAGMYAPTCGRARPFFVYSHGAANAAATPETHPRACVASRPPGKDLLLLLLLVVGDSITGFLLIFYRGLRWRSDNWPEPDVCLC